MPGDDRISRLLNALSGELSQEKLESLGREFEALAQDRAETLLFFVFQNVCQRLAAALEGEAVSVERFEELTVGIADQIADILRDLQQGNACRKARAPSHYAFSKFRFIPSLKFSASSDSTFPSHAVAVQRRQPLNALTERSQMMRDLLLCSILRFSGQRITWRSLRHSIE
jgi:hypothetical protein